jgi:hypothetical protein
MIHDTLLRGSIFGRLVSHPNNWLWDMMRYAICVGCGEFGNDEGSPAQTKVFDATPSMS